MTSRRHRDFSLSLRLICADACLTQNAASGQKSAACVGVAELVSRLEELADTSRLEDVAFVFRSPCLLSLPPCPCWRPVRPSRTSARNRKTASSPLSGHCESARIWSSPLLICFLDLVRQAVVKIHLDSINHNLEWQVRVHTAQPLRCSIANALCLGLVIQPQGTLWRVSSRQVTYSVGHRKTQLWS